MKFLHYSLVILFSYSILYAQEEPVKKVIDLDPAIKKNIIGLLCITRDSTKMNSGNTIKDVDIDPNSLVQAVQWAMTEYPQESIELILWNHGTEEPILWDHGYRAFKFKKNK